MEKKGQVRGKFSAPKRPRRRINPCVPSNASDHELRTELILFPIQSEFFGLLPPDPTPPRRDIPEAVYAELRALARHLMRGERMDHTLEATALVHEAFLRAGVDGQLKGLDRAVLHDRLAETMRRILVDHARSRARLKRGGASLRVPLESLSEAREDDFARILSLDEAIQRLKLLDGEVGRVVELRHYAGLNNDEVADAIGVSMATVKRRWEFARAWLYREVGEDRP